MRKFLLTCLITASGFLALAQERTVSGIVTDSETGEGVVGVTVRIKGTNQGTTTDNLGNYKIAVAENETVLVFSSIGMTAQEIVVGSRSVLDVVMSYDIDELSEVVVIGYGTTTIKDATGAITSVTSKSFNKGNIVTPENLLNGRVAGLTVSTGGAPGSGSTIRIRGGSSLDASNAPLIVINGLPLDETAVGGASSPLSSINPNDIESFTVLKDASATAIYGSRAANGVIIINTKKGGDELKVNVDLQGGVSTLPKKIDVFTADEFRALVADRLPTYVEQLGDANTNWQDEIYRTAYNANANVAVQGSLFRMVPTRFSFNRTDQQGIRLTSKFERNAASLNLSPSLLNNHLKVNINANGAIEKNRFASGQEGNALTFDPTQPVYQEGSPFGGFFQYYALDANEEINGDDLIDLAPFNPVAELLQRKDISTVNRLYGNAKFDYKFHFFPDLTATLNLGVDIQSGEGSVVVSNQNPFTQTNGSIIGSERTYTGTRENSLLDAYLGYNKKVGSMNISATGGYSYQKFSSKTYNSNELLLDTEDTEPISTVATDVVLLAFFGRADFSYNDKYLLTLSYRRDGTSRFINANRWGNFPAAAFAWQLKDDLLPNFSPISTLKLRLGWGITGQQALPNGNEDLYLEKYRQGQPASQYQFGDNIIPIGIPQYRNENLKWEETTSYNIGLDFGLVGNRFSGSVELFQKDSKDLFAIAAISDGSNFSNSGMQNLGDLTTKGVEFTLNAVVLESENGFNWDMNYNVALIDREITRLPSNLDKLVGAIGGGTGGTIQIYRTGFDPSSFYLYNQVYDENGQPVEGAYADLNGDNIINENDKYIFRDGSPNVSMGFLSNMSYKGFDLTFNLRASLGNYIYNNVNSSRAQYSLLRLNSTLSNLPKSVEQSGFNITEDVILSDYFIENGSFLRMDNITLGYTFKNVYKNKASLRLSAGAQNAFVITKYSGLDPEVFGGIDNTIYPRARTIFVGANIQF